MTLARMPHCLILIFCIFWCSVIGELQNLRQVSVLVLCDVANICFTDAFHPRSVFVCCSATVRSEDHDSYLYLCIFVRHLPDNTQWINSRWPALPGHHGNVPLSPPWRSQASNDVCVLVQLPRKLWGWVWWEILQKAWHSPLSQPCLAEDQSHMWWQQNNSLSAVVWFWSRLLGYDRWKPSWMCSRKIQALPVWQLVHRTAQIRMHWDCPKHLWLIQLINKNQNLFLWLHNFRTLPCVLWEFSAWCISSIFETETVNQAAGILTGCKYYFYFPRNTHLMLWFLVQETHFARAKQVQTEWSRCGTCLMFISPSGHVLFVLLMVIFFVLAIFEVLSEKLSLKLVWDAGICNGFDCHHWNFEKSQRQGTFFFCKIYLLSSSLTMCVTKTDLTVR